MSAIRHQVSVDASSRTVWTALTTEAGVTGWWAETARIDARDGGRIVLSTRIGDALVEERGIFHQVRPTRTLEITWDSVGTSPTRGAKLQLQVGRGDGETKVHVVLSGGEGLEDEETRAQVDEFWKGALLRLRDVLEA
ncbi:MAG: SRPBCC domain-containing protein [Alphaproteobacteria bacterium]|nr:SRPBCC domain-containing protein [Alphaproteobacteria bacterium]